MFSIFTIDRQLTMRRSEFGLFGINSDCWIYSVIQIYFQRCCHKRKDTITREPTYFKRDNWFTEFINRLNFRAFVVTSTQNHRIIHFFNIIKILNKYLFTALKFYCICLHCLHSSKRRSDHLFFPDLKSLLFSSPCCRVNILTILSTT